MAGIVAIGASSGGVQALRTLVAGLPADFDAPILVVLHIGAARSILPSLLSEMDSIRASHAVDCEPILKHHIYVAPPDHHLVAVDGHVRLSRGPRENWARPAIDPLFRSVAESFGPLAIGVVLSGSLNDGTVGLYEIKNHGGIAIVQDPDEAESSSMPKSALDNVAIDYCKRIAEIPPLLGRLTKRLEKSTKGETGVHAMPSSDQNLSVPAAQTCPECGGAMREERLGTLRQFRCHIGHVMTAEVLAAAKLEMLENDISVCVRAANERAELCREIARSHDAQKKSASAARWRQAAEEAKQRASELAKFAERDWISPNGERESGQPELASHAIHSAGRN